MTDGIMSMFDSDADLTLSHDFDKATVEEKIEFVSVVFVVLQDVVESDYSLPVSRYQEIYSAQWENIISDLEGHFNFYDFCCYFISFFKEAFGREAEPISIIFFRKYV